jgi:hypothetical protein
MLTDMTVGALKTITSKSIIKTKKRSSKKKSQPLAYNHI